MTVAMILTEATLRILAWLIPATIGGVLVARATVR